MSGVGVINYIPILLGHLEAGRVPQAAAWLHSLPPAERTALARAMAASRERALSEALRSGNSKKLERILQSVSARIRADRFADGSDLAASLREILEVQKPEVVAFRTRMAREPILRRWVNMALPVETLKVSPHFSEKFLRSQFTAVLSFLDDLSEPLNHMPWNRLRDELLIALRNAHIPFEKKVEADSRASFELVAPKGIEPWSKEDVDRIVGLLEQAKQKGYLEEEELEKFRIALIHGLFIFEEWARYREARELTYTASLWSHTEAEVQALQLAPHVLEDLSVQVIVLRRPDGKIVGGMVLRLFQNAKDNRVSIFASYAPDMRIPTRYPLEVQTRLLRMATADVGLKNVGAPVIVSAHHRVDRLTWSTQFPFFPVSAPIGVEEAIKTIQRQSRHPHEAFFSEPFVTYEAMREAKDAKAHLNPWLGENVPPLIQLAAAREIEPDPKVAEARNYLWAFMGGPGGRLRFNGRSVDYYLGPDGWVSPDGTHWHHLSSIGVGPTNWVRAGEENRDGRLPLEGAWRRFYLTNMMHTIADPLGFRTSLGVSVTNFRRVRKGGERHPGIPQVEAKIDELRREQLRLSNLTTNSKTAQEMIDHAAKKVAIELGLRKMTREQYVRWLARTLGEQFSIMLFFGFDHGLNEGSPQLGPWNVSLLGEIVDFDSAQMGLKSRGRYFHNGDVGEDHVDIRHIETMEHFWRSKEGRSVENWLEVLLTVAPDVKFVEELLAAFVAKDNELKQLAIDPKKAIRDFNREVWGPFIKSARRH